MHRLDPLFRFSSLAVVGASDSSSLGGGPYRASQDVGFTGRFFPINPRRPEVHGLAAFPDVASLPEPIEAVVIVVGREHVLAAVRAAADRGARTVAIVSAGFAEQDEQGRALQRELTDLAHARGLLVVGPNAFGVASVVNRCAAFTGSGLDESRPGNVGVISNSGGMLNEIISYGNARQLGFSHLVSTGNEANVSAADVLDYFVDDPATDVVLAILETVRDPRLFVAAAERAAAARKPIVVLKLGASAKGAESALSHTAALSGSDAVYKALFRQKGILRVDDIDELIETGALLSPAVGALRRGRLEKAAVIEISGGGKGLVCDTAEAAGVELPDLTEAGSARLRTGLPSHVEPSNPLDTGGAWGAPEMPELYPLALRTLASEPEIDIIISRYTVPRTGGLGVLRARLDELIAVRAEHPERLFGVLSRTSDQFSPEWARAIREADVPFLQGYGRGMRAIGRLAAYSRYLRSRASAAAIVPPTSPVPPPARGTGTLNEVEAKDLLRAAGLPIVQTAWARSADEALEQAERFGYPVAAKVISPQIVHKSDVGGVRLNLAGPDAVRQAFDALGAVVESVPGAEFQGAAIQPMAPPGLELVIGAHRDPQFGPVVLFGLGGIMVEVLADVALRVAPLTEQDARDMLDEIRGRRILDGARGQPPVDRPALLEALLRLSAFILAQPAIASVDLNPIFAYPDGLLAADARIVLGAGPEANPRDHR